MIESWLEMYILISSLQQFLSIQMKTNNRLMIDHDDKHERIWVSRRSPLRNLVEYADESARPLARRYVR
jgi:hypothetical protein